VGADVRLQDSKLFLQNDVSVHWSFHYASPPLTTKQSDVSYSIKSTVIHLDANLVDVSKNQKVSGVVCEDDDLMRFYCKDLDLPSQLEDTVEITL